MKTQPEKKRSLREEIARLIKNKTGISRKLINGSIAYGGEDKNGDLLKI